MKMNGEDYLEISFYIQKYPLPNLLIHSLPKNAHITTTQQSHQPPYGGLNCPLTPGLAYCKCTFPAPFPAPTARVCCALISLVGVLH